jgi:two-component system response regulator YesN
LFNILVVDDEQIERTGIKFLVKKFNLPLSVVEANNGEEALQIMENNKIDILLTDIKMPFMDGMELCERVRLKYPYIKIIIFSAYGEFEYAKKAINFSISSYILKPIDINEFQAVFSKIISQCEKEEIEKEKNEEILKAFEKIAGTNEIRINSISEGNGENEESTDSTKKVIKDILKIIEENYMKDISLEWIAEKVYLSQSYLSALFSKEMGQSLVKYITQVRMKKAEELIINTNMKIVDIGIKVGYLNHSYFCMTFKNLYGVSAAKFREMKK